MQPPFLGWMVSAEAQMCSRYGGITLMRRKQGNMWTSLLTNMTFPFTMLHLSCCKTSMSSTMANMECSPVMMLNKELEWSGTLKTSLNTGRGNRRTDNIHGTWRWPMLWAKTKIIGPKWTSIKRVSENQNNIRSISWSTLITKET